MSTHLDHLDGARDALLHADPAGCAREIEAFEALCAERPPAVEDLATCEARLRVLGLMADACAEGVTAARQDLQDALIAAGRLTTYDSAGSRATRNTRRVQGRRY
ncbi:hypothetical protein DRW48_05340 [Paracoccus suum]|uniref:Flagellar protein FlgN n=1 Tax=Paracoccus suum TaxID=2259340 RepID=A0A344PIH9_9RHOB|nr:hypothetical protein [Paracoccus suum]AXC49184.1 hypothetical protein DRW48_05340 [Paracoccus suum]